LEQTDLIEDLKFERRRVVEEDSQIATRRAEKAPRLRELES